MLLVIELQKFNHALKDVVNKETSVYTVQW